MPDSYCHEHNITPHSSSPIPISPNKILPHPLTADEIKMYVSAYSQAARNAISRDVISDEDDSASGMVGGAGFDAVELHFANGYLPDQFLQDVCNKRDDEYGGSVENRCRFMLEVLEGVVQAVGEERVGIRVSPWSPFQGMLLLYFFSVEPC
jgi:NADPH2 dehydrogenase